MRGRVVFSVVLASLSLSVTGCFLTDSSDDGGSDAEQICTPGVTKCKDGDLDKCTQDGATWVFHEECQHGCGGGLCLDVPCVPNCDGKECGDDGCGGVCGHCPSGDGSVNDTLCQSGGQCMDPCVADCLGRECGVNICGGTCGKCESGWVCIHNAQCVPQAVSVYVVDAIIGPGKVTGGAWDGFGTVPPEVFDIVSNYVDLGNVDELLDYIVNGGLAALAAPEPIGTADIDIGQGFLAEYQIVLADKTNNWEDTYTPTFLNGNGGWTGVPFTEQTRIRVTLEDLDLQNDDPIGTAIINYGDLVEAWAENTKFWINVATQTQNQLLFLGVVVSPDVL